MPQFVLPIGKRISSHQRCVELSVIFDGVDTENFAVGAAAEDGIKPLFLQAGDAKATIPC